MKTYFGIRTTDDVTNKRVFVRLSNGREYDLPHVVRHGPTGFEWGYGSLGGADLALSLLTDAFGEEVAEANYESLRLKEIMLFPYEAWTLTEEDLRKFMKDV